MKRRTGAGCWKMMSQRLDEVREGRGIGVIASEGNRSGAGQCPNRRRPYASPALQRFGDIRDYTLGGSIGPGDSGDSGVKRPPVF